MPVIPASEWVPQAVQWTGANRDQVAQLADVIAHEDNALLVQAFTGKCAVERGDWVVELPAPSYSRMRLVIVLEPAEFDKFWQPANHL